MKVGCLSETYQNTSQIARMVALKNVSGEEILRTRSSSGRGK